METQTQQAKTFANKEFKSYYVVWKLFWTLEYIARQRLNRTMQYGNSVEREEDERKKKSLNRTMQYGNQKKSGRPYRFVSGLNRTMQYGNKSF